MYTRTEAIDIKEKFLKKEDREDIIAILQLTSGYIVVAHKIEDIISSFGSPLINLDRLFILKNKLKYSEITINRDHIISIE